MMPCYVYKCCFNAASAETTFTKTAAMSAEAEGGRFDVLGFPSGIIDPTDAEPFEVHWLDKGRISMALYSFDPCADMRFRERCITELILRNDEVKDYRRRLWGQLRRRS